MSIYGFLGLSVLFTLFMLFVSLKRRHDGTIETFFAANRNVGVFGIAVSTAVSWQWADNLFSTAQVGYDYGIQGIIWFALTTIISFVIFAFIAEKIRSQAPNALTIPEFVTSKCNKSKSVHIAMTVAIILFQIFALTLGATVTGLLLNAAFGFNYIVCASTAIILALVYSMISGLKASVVTDVVQFVMMFVLMIIIIGIVAIGIDTSMITSDLIYGKERQFVDFFNYDLVMGFGIPMAIILFVTPIVDQMIFQRLVAYKEGSDPIKPFLWAGVICAAFVLIFSVIGIFGQVLVVEGSIRIVDTQMTVIEVVRHIMPEFGLTLFIIAFLGTVFSTTDSVYSAVSSLVGMDIYKKYYLKDKKNIDAKILRVGRIAMLFSAVFAIVISLTKLNILWILFIIGAVGSTVAMPVLFAIYSKKLAPRYVMLGIIFALIVSLPLSIYGNVVGDVELVSAGSLVGLVIGMVFCSIAVFRR